MEKNTTLRFALLIFFSIGLYAQDLYTYKLFNNEFQAVFPGQPSVQEIPKEVLDPIAIEKSLPYEYKKQLTRKQVDKIVSDVINKNNIQSYIYADRDNQIAYTSQSGSSGFKHDIGEYKQSTKKFLDDSVIEPLKSLGQKIISFSSEFNRKENIYIALVSSSYFTEGVKMYKSTKFIYYKKKTYHWSVIHVDIQDKQIFDTYSKYSKVIK